MLCHVVHALLFSRRSFVVSSCTFEAHYCHFVIFSDDSQVAYVFIVLAIILFIVMVAMISVICIKSGKKKLPPADVIPEVSFLPAITTFNVEEGI